VVFDGDEFKNEFFSENGQANHLRNYFWGTIIGSIVLFILIKTLKSEK
jgi:hypothetical protein